MCGRFALDTTSIEIKTQFHVGYVPKISSSFNIAPTQNALILIQSPIDGTRTMELFTWGLIPYFAKDKKMNPPLINARAETLAMKPAFRTSFKSKRGIVIMSGYFEWQQLEHHKQPYYIMLKNNKLLAVAALWDTWQSQAGEVVHSCCLITTQANSFVERFHDRMPVILNEEQQQIWVNMKENDTDILEALLVSRENKEMMMYPVTPKMNNWRYADADAIQPIIL